MTETITVQFDGGSRGNPGPAGVGAVLAAQDGTTLVAVGRFIGPATNNVAEYRALITGLEEAKKFGARRIVVRGDSELVVKQLLGQYRVKNAQLQQLFQRAKALLAEFEKWGVEHNVREHNVLADKLANLAMDRRRDVSDADLAGDAGDGPAVKPAGDEVTCPQCGHAFHPRARRR